MAERTTRDGAGFRCEILQHHQHADLRIQYGSDGNWTDVQSWEAPCSANSRERRLILTASAREHGWHLDIAEWPRASRGRTVLTLIHPDNWTLILKEITAVRDQYLDEFARLDHAWQVIITKSVTIGHLTRATAAEAAQISPGRVYQIRSAIEDGVAAEDKAQVIGRAAAHRKAAQ